MDTLTFKQTYLLLYMGVKMIGSEAAAPSWTSRRIIYRTLEQHLR